MKTIIKNIVELVQTETKPRKWIAGSDVQVAPQETEISSYIIGGTKQDVEKNTFSGFKL
mgnify:CR=1 FL=1